MFMGICACLHLEGISHVCLSKTHKLSTDGDGDGKNVPKFIFNLTWVEVRKKKKNLLRVCLM